MKKTLSRSDILNATSRLKTETIELPEWGGSVVVRELTGAERDAWEASIITSDGAQSPETMRNVRAKLIVKTIIDDEGELLFTDDDIDRVGALSGSTLNKIFEVACRLSALTAAEMDELEGN